MSRFSIVHLLCSLSLTTCGAQSSPSANAGNAGRGSNVTAAVPSVPHVAAIAPQCSAPAYRGLDFWIGDWDAVLRTRDREGAETWTETRGANHIEAVLGGCGLEESFHAEGNPPWAGKSLSRYVESEKKWRQAWIDDSGSYLAFVGEASPTETILTGEARPFEGGTKQMRMVFTNITANHFDWRWEATKDGGKTWRAMMLISYTRHV